MLAYNEIVRTCITSIRLYKAHLHGQLQFTIYTHIIQNRYHTQALRCTRATLPCQQPGSREKSPSTMTEKQSTSKSIPKKGNRDMRNLSKTTIRTLDTGHLSSFHRRLLHEKPMVLPSSHRNRVHSSINIVCRYERSSVKPNTVIPALLFSKYVTARDPNTAEN